ncbi:N-acetyl sugar amidotransferase [Gammaproteobacteria bacterium]
MREYQICSNCVMDTSDPEIVFDEQGVCNHCKIYKERAENELRSGNAGRIELNSIIDKIKAEGKGKNYDCVIGVSGGVDSTYVAYIAKKLGLRPLAVHFDNGWNSELAVKNIENTLKKMDIDLYTKVVNWEEFRELQLDFLKASIINVEIPTDHAIMATLMQISAKYGIRNIILGGNIATESSIPFSWTYENRDSKIIKSIYSAFSHKKLKTVPLYGFLDLFFYLFIKRIRFFSILNYVNYNKDLAITTLEKELDWRPYGYKHGESVYTKFYQSYILPTKFNVDKRRAHLSSIINSRQMTRDEALQEIAKPYYASKESLEADIDYVVKKLAIDRSAFDQIMALPIRSYRDYPSNAWFFIGFKKIIAAVKKIATI